MADALPKEIAAKARQDAFENLAICERYCRCARQHLELADDVVVIMDLLRAREHFAAALRAFAPIREAMKEPDRPALSEAAE
jgi:hypothetical protein